MQFAVPQFTEVEDRLIGSLTLKQFLVLLGTGGVLMFLWSVLQISFLFFILAVPISIIGIGAALGKYNGRPIFTYLVPFAAYLGSTKVMIFKREPAMISVSKAEVVKHEDKKTLEKAAEELEPAESRLKKLAYLLDRKAHEEEEIISNDDRGAFVATSNAKIDFSKLAREAAKGISNIAKESVQTVRQEVADVAGGVQMPTFTSNKKESAVKQSTRQELPKIQQLASKPVGKPRAVKKAAAEPKKSKKFDPSSILDPNA